MCPHLIDIQDKCATPQFKDNLNIIYPTSKKSFIMRLTLKMVSNVTSLSSAMTTVSRRLNIQCIKFKIRAFFITTLFARLYMMVGILLTCIKHLHDHNISLRGEGQEYKTSLTLPLFIEVPVPSQESEQSCICVLGEYILPHVAIVLLDFGIVPSAWYIVFFI